MNASPTRFAGLGYRREGSMWRFVDLSTDAAIGETYRTKAKLLANCSRFAFVRGFSA